MSLGMYKLVAAPVVFAAGLLGGILPRWRGVRGHTSFLAVSDSFAAGVFFGVGLLHMLPAAGEALAQVSGYPLAALLAASGFTGLVFVEQALLRGRDAEALSQSRDLVTAWIVTGALSIHSLVAGLALGTQQTFGAFAIVLAAIVAHKSSAAFALGRVVQQAQPSARRFYSTVLLFCFTTPVGILGGAALSNSMRSNSARLLGGAFDALAAGTFLYVALAEILPRELRHAHRRLPLCAGFSGGLATMALVRIWT